MKYRLKEGSLNDINNPMKTLLLNRGIENWNEYINLKEDCVHDYNLLQNIEEAVKCLKYHIENESKIHIIVDCDIDGYTSGAMVCKYIKDVSWTADVSYSLHTKKQHGLTDDVMYTWSEDTKLIIVPDAGSNDVEQCKELKSKGYDVIIIDHHIMDKKNDYAIVVNCQDKTYPNKNLCGAGVVYKFLKAMDEELWENCADKYIDLVALGNIADSMDVREFETRYFINTGISKITNKLFKALIEKQSYVMGNDITMHSIMFSISPILNACIRVANQADKELLFRAFIETDEIFKYKKRGESEEVDEDIYKRAARLCGNAKSRQDKEVQKAVSDIVDNITSSGMDLNKILFINATNLVNETLTGLCAIKIADRYNKPCVMLRLNKNSKNDNIIYGGSCRNFDDSPIESLKAFLTSTKLFNYIQGHDNAAGVSIKRDNIPMAIQKCNELLKGTDFDKLYNCDFIIDGEDLDVSFIKAIDEMGWLYGQKVQEPVVCIKNVTICIDDLMIMGKESDTWKYVDNEKNIAYVKFKVNKEKDSVLNEFGKLGFNENDEFKSDEDKKYVTVDIIGNLTINNYNNILTPQVVIREYVVVG